MLQVLLLYHFNVVIFLKNCISILLGAFPKFILKGYVANTIKNLSKCAELTEDHSNWAEARRDAIKALSQVASTVGIDSNENENNAICQSNLDALFSSFLAGTNDYTLDSRGEIGAIVRESALLAIQVKGFDLMYNSFFICNRIVYSIFMIAHKMHSYSFLL